MSYPEFICAVEKDHNPPLTEEAEHYYQIARQLEKAKGLKDWSNIVANYEKAIELGHWKAMNNLASLYYKGGYVKGDKSDNPTGVRKDREKMAELYTKMVELGVPIGYYNFAVALERGHIKASDPSDASYFMYRAASLGSPLAQVRLGNFFSYGLPREKQRDDLAEPYFHCAGKQDNAGALIEVASFYKIVKNNYAKALYYYQKAASLGNETGFLYLTMVFNEENPRSLYYFGYQPDVELVKKFDEMYRALERNADLRFPNLMKDYPLPRHPTQGYDADNPDVRPED